MTDASLFRLLLVEDNPTDAELAVRELKRAGMRVEPRVVDAEASYRHALADFAPTVILSDFSMPGFDGMAALALARQHCPETPFIFVSGTLGEEYAIRALKNGATDYVLKTNLVRLPAAVERAIADARHRAEQRRIEAELKATRERLESISMSLPDVLWSVDAVTCAVLFVSPAASEIYGRPPEEFLAKHDLWLDVIHPDDRPRVRDVWERFMQGGSFDLEYRIVHPGGSYRWLHHRARRVPGASGTPVRVDGMARDITVQVEHREHIARLSRIRDLMSETNAAIVRIRDRQALFGAFCRIAVEHGAFLSACIVEHDAANRKVRLATAAGAWHASFETGIARYNASPGAAHGLLAEALRTGSATVSNDATSDARTPLRDSYAGQGIHSVACLPYTVEGAVAGVIVFGAKERNYFDQEELRLVLELAGNLGFGLELLAKQERIAYLAHHDALTGLPNRLLFDLRLTQTIEAARPAGQTVTLVICDVERFRAINDALGRGVGDRLLQAVARRVRKAAGTIDRAARLGGDEFAVVLVGPEQDPRGLEEDTARFFAKPFEVDGQHIRVNAKFGAAAFPKDGTDATALFRNAEASLKLARETGEPLIFYAPHINARVAEQHELENRLRHAVEHGELFLHYQPKVALVSKRIVGVEALMRWQGADGSLVPPAKFIPLLEQTGLILEAGQQALAAARRAYRDWQARGLATPRIAVNVSALQLRRRTFVQDVCKALGDCGPDGGGIDLEVTESLLMTDVDESIRKLRALRDRGLRIALDDFGTGYSSLAYLSRLPLDALKIDRGFIRGITENPEDTSLVSTIISLAQALKLNVVAEGVETEQQAHLLRLLRCDQAQGYLFGPPVAAADLASQFGPAGA